MATKKTETKAAPAEEKTETPVEKKETPAVDYSKLNVMQKLMIARRMFLEACVKKTGKNMHLQFMYFELADIVPPATQIFEKVGLLKIDNFNIDHGEGASGNGDAIATVYNTDDPHDRPIQFIVPYTPIQPIVSNAGKQATNEMQATGSSLTYIRRYLWQVVLDIVEADSIDANLGVPDGSAPAAKPAAAPVVPKKTAPATPAQRESIKQQITAADGPADEMQITALKNALKDLMNADPTQEEKVQVIAVQTQGFTQVSKAQCEALIGKVREMIAAGKDGK